MNDFKQGIEDVLVEVLEQQAFLDGEAVDCSELPTSMKDGVQVVLEFHGSRSGHMTFMCSNELSEELAINVLGLDGPDELATEDADDALTELTNVIAGRLLALLSEEEELFELEHGELAHDGDGSRWESMKQVADVCGFLVEDHPTLVQLVLE